jgi:2-iminobutanoate/2-iminopropanoate deaminase
MEVSIILKRPLIARILHMTKKAPKAIGPYSRSTRAGELLFVSGQVAIDPESGKLVEDSIEVQTRQVLHNIEAVLEEHGLSLESVVKTEVYLKDLNDFAAMNEIYATFFSFPTKPARQAMQVARLPLDARIEISCIAHIQG